MPNRFVVAGESTTPVAGCLVLSTSRESGSGQCRLCGHLVGAKTEGLLKALSRLTPPVLHLVGTPQTKVELICLRRKCHSFAQ